MLALAVASSPADGQAGTSAAGGTPLLSERIEVHGQSRELLTLCEWKAPSPSEDCVRERILTRYFALYADRGATDEAILREEIRVIEASSDRGREVAYRLALFRNLVGQDRHLGLLRELQPLLADRVKLGKYGPERTFELRLLEVRALMKSGQIATALDRVGTLEPDSAVAPPALRGLFFQVRAEIHYLNGLFATALGDHDRAVAALMQSAAGRDLLPAALASMAMTAINVDSLRAATALARINDLQRDGSQSADPIGIARGRVFRADHFDGLFAMGFVSVLNRRDDSAFPCGNGIGSPDEPVAQMADWTHVTRYNTYLGLNALWHGHFERADHCLRWGYWAATRSPDLSTGLRVAPLVGLVLAETRRSRRAGEIDMPRVINLIYTARHFGDHSLPPGAAEIRQLRTLDFALARAFGFHAEAYDRAQSLLYGQTELEGVTRPPSAELTNLAAHWAVEAAWGASHPDVQPALFGR